MPSFGENLRREREKRNITLEQISQSTKIGTRMLQALEEDKFNQLPGGIFNKGFVRAYARHLGLDEDQTVTEYLEASGDAPPVQPELPTEEMVPQVRASPDTPQRPLPWGMFAAILLLAALALSIWSHRQKKQDGAATQSPPRAPATQQFVENTQPAPTLNSLSAPDRDQPSDAPAAPVKAQLESALPTTAGEFVVVVQAREPTWTAITSDGRTVYAGVLAAGDQRAIRGHRKVVVKAGNAGGIDLLFNGTKVDLPGKPGEVRTITLGSQGITPNDPESPLAQ